MKGKTKLNRDPSEVYPAISYSGGMQLLRFDSIGVLYHLECCILSKSPNSPMMN